MNENTLKLITWYFQNKSTIDRLKEDQYVQELLSRLKDLAKIFSHVWAEPDVKELFQSLKTTLDLGAEDKPVINIRTGAHGANPLNAKGDL
jgi:D-alanyl-D-alanine carboxypeptidase